MNRFPNQRPARLAGLESSLTVTHRGGGPSWALFGRTLAMGLIVFVTFAVVAFAACSHFSP